MVSASISSRSSGLPPWRHSVAKSSSARLGLRVLANAELPRRLRASGRGASRARSCQLASQWCMPVRQYGSSSWAVTTGVMPRVTRWLAVLGGQRAQNTHQRQIGRRPRLVEPFLADRPAAVVGQPGQVGVQDEGEQARASGARIGTGGRHGRTAIATRSRLSSMSVSVASTRSKSSVVTEATSASRSVGPRCVGQRAGDLGVDDRAAVAGVELDQPRAVEHPQHRVDREARAGQQFGQLGGVELPGVERVDRGVAAGGEGDPVGRRHQQHPAGPQDPQALGDELPLVPEVFDHLEVDHHIDSPVGQRQLGKVAVAHLDPRVAGAHVGDRGLVVVEPDHAGAPRRRSGRRRTPRRSRPRARRGPRSGRPAARRRPHGGGTSSSPPPGRAPCARRSGAAASSRPADRR